MAVFYALESKFDPVAATKWMRAYWPFSIYLSLLYVIFIYAGTRFMRNRAPYNLTKALFLWNIALAVFSTIGAAVCFHSLASVVYEIGVLRSICWMNVIDVPHLSIWAFIFSLSKAAELFDTFFIVMRKSQLIFLHWYHHTTVLTFAWYFYAYPAALGQWMTPINYGIHSLMYTYYALRAAGVRVPLCGSQMVTILQLMQMFIGIVYNAYGAYVVSVGGDCMLPWGTFVFAMTIYGSYAVLFIHYYVQRYIWKKPKEKAS